MARYRLTDATVKKLPAPENGNKIYYDTLIDGFGLRVTKNNARAFVLNYRTRVDRQERRFTIGAIENWPTTIALSEAAEARHRCWPRSTSRDRNRARGTDRRESCGPLCRETLAEEKIAISEGGREAVPHHPSRAGAREGR